MGGSTKMDQHDQWRVEKHAGVPQNQPTGEGHPLSMSDVGFS